MLRSLSVCAFLCGAIQLCGVSFITACASEPSPAMRGCAFGSGNYFAEEVWAKVAVQSCLTCHKAGGDAEDSDLVLVDPTRSAGPARDEAMRHNFGAFLRAAMEKDGATSKLLLKVAGELDHGGKVIYRPNSAGYRILSEFVRRTADSNTADSVARDNAMRPLSDADRSIFKGVAMLDDRRLLRRAALSLAARLPTEDEIKQVEREGLPAVDRLLDGLMSEEAFYDRLREGFNDIFLTVGYDDGAESALSYDHFSKTRHWTQNFDLSHIEGEDAQRKARYKLADDYRAALFAEPMRLVEHIVRNDRPFTEIVTADYIMVTPYTARGYGIFEEVRDRFKNIDDPFESIPVQLKALVGRNRPEDQESKTGLYPHAGLLTMFQYLRRYPTTETNRNRLRARMVYQHFLGIDALELAARVADAAAVTAKYPNPTMEASECVVCHRMIDPIAGLFQDYYKFEGVYGRRKEGWYKDMFAAGYEEEELPSEERWRALQWLGERIARDPRFAVAMTEHVYFILTGRKVLQPPKDMTDPHYEAKFRAARSQRCTIEEIAAAFRESGFQLKVAFKRWILSDYYRADAPAENGLSAERLAELDDIGHMHLLTPEQLERKTAAIFGRRWGKLNDQLAMLYGGIDSKEVTERATDPSGAMGAIQRTLANDVACRHVLQDFVKPAVERRLFRKIEPSAVPRRDAAVDTAIREQLADLHDLILGRYDSVDSEEIDRSFKLFAGLVSEAREIKGLDNREAYHCRRDLPDSPNDPEYTIRAWRGVVTYLLRRPEYLYE
ncbi:MAG: DUF1592 domain-containing protein [Pirellulales bacterium]